MSEDKLVSRTLRMPTSHLKRFEEEAKNRDLSFNAYVNQVHAKYLDFDLFVEGARPVVLSRASLLSILNYPTKEQIEQAGIAAGSEVLSSLFTHYNIKPSLDSIITYY